jgi:hypothetical protein
MIQYHVWFSLKPGTNEKEGLSAVQTFLQDLLQSGAVGGFHLLKNSGKPPKTKLLPFHALIEFRDGAQFGAAFAAQAKRGIHNGAHGQVMAIVAEFQIEVFEELVL